MKNLEPGNRTRGVISKLENIPNFRIIKEGSQYFIVDANGRKVSEGYHEFQTFNVKEGDHNIMVIVGKIGGVKYILRPPLNEGGQFERTTERYHDLEYRSDLGGFFVTTLGALSYMIDSNTGQKISNGYHSIYKEGGVLYGRLGAAVEEIKLREALPPAPINLKLES